MGSGTFVLFRNVLTAVGEKYGFDAYQPINLRTPPSALALLRSFDADASPPKRYKLARFTQSYRVVPR